MRSQYSRLVRRISAARVSASKLGSPASIAAVSGIDWTATWIGRDNPATWPQNREQNPAPLLRKDFDLGFAAAHDLDVPMPVTAAAAAAVQAAVSSGRVDEDFAILLDLQARASGLELKPEDVVVDDGLSGGGTP